MSQDSSIALRSYKGLYLRINESDEIEFGDVAFWFTVEDVRQVLPGMTATMDIVAIVAMSVLLVLVVAARKSIGFTKLKQ